MNFYLPTRIITGKGCVEASANKLCELGGKCLIVTGKGSAKKCGALEDVKRALDSVNVRYEVFDKITQNPRVGDCIEGGKIARETGAEFIIGIGGGSPLDASKAIATFATNDIDETDFYGLKWNKDPLRVVAVGTTAGTGSEVTQVAVITASDGRKKSTRHEKSFPVLCLGDARYTEFMPDEVTRSTAADALSHCLESYFCRNANDISRSFALRGIKLAVDAFTDLKLGIKPHFKMRENLYLASLYGGIAISVTGTAFPHALGYFLTENYGVAHGTACAAYLTEFIRYNRKNARELANELFVQLGIDENTLIRLIETVAPPMNVSVTEDEVRALYKRWINNTCIAKMYGEMTPDKLQDIVLKCIVK